MEVFKKVCKVGGVICLIGVAYFRSVEFAIAAVALAVVAAVIEIKDWRK